MENYKMINKYILIISLFSFISSPVLAQRATIKQEFIIRTNLSFWDSIVIKITCEDETLYNDSFFNKQIEIRGKTNRTKEGFLIIKKGGLSVTTPFYIESGIILIRDFAKNYTLFQASGTLNNDLSIGFYKMIDSLIPFKSLLDGKLTQNQYDEKKRLLAKEFIKNNANSIIVPAIYRAYFIDANIPDTEKIDVFNLFSPKMKSSYTGIQLSKELEIIKRTAQGKSPPSFILQDTNNKSVSLQEFNGKYVLIDFWASWCGPCRAQNPALRNIFEKYKNENFQIISISLDIDRKRWINAINEDSLPWIQLSDLKGWLGETGKSYHIISIPANILLNTGGKILGKNFTPADLEIELSAIIRK
jgi:thiol-disulfide isomerase/thioredoxin